MKFLLIGGAGFIGSWLARYLIDRDHKVIIIDPLIEYESDLPKGKKIRDFRNKHLLKKSRIYNEKFEDIGEAIIKKEKPQVVIHLAGYPLEHTFDSPFSLKQLADDITLTYHVVSAVKKYKVRKFIFLSSIAAYGDFDYSISENAHLNPTTVYGVSKASGEFLIKSNLDNWIIIRSTNVYGFGDLHKRSVNTIIDHALNNKKFWINENAWLDFIYVKDFVEGIIEAVSKAPTKETFHISGGKAQTLATFIRYLRPYFKLKYEIKNLADKPRRGTMDNSKARIMLGWSPKMDLESGIIDYLKYVKRYKIS